MEKWKKSSADEEIRVGWRTLTKKTFIQPGGNQLEFHTYGKTTDRHGAVIALTQDDTVVVAEQFRVGPEEIMQELPGGNIEVGEAPEAGVLRELLEETGYEGDEVSFLGEAPKDAYMNARWFFYLVTNCKKVREQSLDDGELVNVQEISIEQLIENAKTGKMTDAVAVLLAYERLQKILNERVIQKEE